MYVGDIFVLFESPESAHSFCKCMSSKHQNINFTIEQEKCWLTSFLDTKICHKNGKFVTSVYRKPTFSGAFTNYESFIPTYQKRGLLCCNYSPSSEDFPLLTRESNDFKLKIMESLPIVCDKPILNKADSFLSLELF